MTAEKTYQSLRADVSSRIEQKLKELQALTADDIIDMYKAEAEKLSVLDGKYPGTGGIRTFITGRDKFTYDFIDLDQYYIKEEVDEMLEEEKKEREDADEALDERMTDWEDRLEKEIEERKEADADLLDQIDKEVERAKDAEADLQQQINDEISRATAAEEDLQNQLNNEIARAETAEKDLQQQINDEISRAKDTEADLLDQLNKEITRAETTEANEEAARKAADQNIVDWSKGHFVDVINTIGDSPLTLETSYNYDSDGYKVYTIHGTVDCYSKHEIDEVVDGLEQSDYQLQQGIDNVQDGVNNVQSGVDNLLASMQSQIDAITANYITSIGTDTTSPLFLSTNKSGNSVTITGHVDLGDYYTKSEIDSFLADINSTINIGLDSKQDVLTAGTGIDITNNVISCTLDNTVFKIVEELPTSDINTNVIYVVTGETTGKGDNLYSEYIYVNGQWEKIGEFKADTDLSNYYTKKEVDDLITSIKADVSDLKNIWYAKGTSTVISMFNVDRSYMYPDTGTPEVGDLVLFSLVDSLSVTEPTCSAQGLYYVSSISGTTYTITHYTGATWGYASYTLSGLGGIDTINASGTSPLTLSASKNGTTATITGSVDLSDYYTKEEVDNLIAGTSGGAALTWIGYGNIIIEINGTDISRTSLLPTSSYGTPKVGDAVLYFYVNYDDPQSVLIGQVKAVSDSTVTVSLMYGFDIISNNSTSYKLYSETSYSATIETPNVGYGTISTVWSGGNGNMMTITTDYGNTIMHGNYIDVTGSNGVGSITIDGNKVLTEADLDADAINSEYNYNNSYSTSMSSTSSKLHIVEVYGTGSNSHTVTILPSDIPTAHEMYWIIHNAGTGTYEYRFGAAERLNHICVDGNTTLTIQPDEYGEISMISDGTNVYIRSASQS